MIVALTKAKQQDDAVSSPGAVRQPPMCTPKNLFDLDPERHRLVLREENDCIRALKTAVANFSI